MTRSQSIARLVLGVAMFIAIGGLPASVAVLAQVAQDVPSADRGAALAVNYTRLRPQIATAGVLKDGAVPRLKTLGFATVVDLRGPDEGTAVEKKAVGDAGIRYVNIPVRGAPTDAQVTAFARVVEDAQNTPLLVHCASGNRVGAMWALYRAQKGAPAAVALEEGRAIGLHPDRAAELRKRLDKTPPAR